MADKNLCPFKNRCDFYEDGCDSKCMEHYENSKNNNIGIHPADMELVISVDDGVF